MDPIILTECAILPPRKFLKAGAWIVEACSHFAENFGASILHDLPAFASQLRDDPTGFMNDTAEISRTPVINAYSFEDIQMLSHDSVFHEVVGEFNRKEFDEYVYDECEGATLLTQFPYLRQRLLIYSKTWGVDSKILMKRILFRLSHEELDDDTVIVEDIHVHDAEFDQFIILQ